MGYMEFKAASVDDAITNASMTLGVPSTELEYKVVDEGSKGIFGIGKKPAVILAQVKEESKKETVSQEQPVKEKAVPAKKTVPQEKPVVKESVKPVEHKVETKPLEKPETAENAIKKERVIKNPENADEIVVKTKQFLDELFAAMKIETKVDISFDKEKNDINIELSGDEMGVLIGKRGNTLDALQYLTSLYCNKLSDVYIRVKLDTENYRFRRRQTLEHLAKNIAFKVKKTRRPVYLEPMNPYERRIIHSALQNDRYVTTKSEGEEPYRKVIVLLKNQ